MSSAIRRSQRPATWIIRPQISGCVRPAGHTPRKKRNGAERLVRDAAQTGVPLIDAGRFLIRVGVRGIEHQAVGVTPLDLSLKNVCLAIAVTTVSQQIIAEFRVWKASIICRGRKAVSVIYGARGHAVTGGRTPRRIVGRDFIEVNAADQTMRCRSQIRKRTAVLSPI